MKRKLFAVIIAAVILIAIGVSVYMFFFSPTISGKYRDLQYFSVSTAGDMSGGHNVLEIRLEGDHAVIRTDTAESHNSVPEVREYQADASILKEIGDVFRKYRMDRWHHRKFTNEFISDGANTDYSFRFEKESVNFSSQYYPEPYGSKLAKIREIIDKYLK